MDDVKQGDNITPKPESIETVFWLLTTLEKTSYVPAR